METNRPIRVLIAEDDFLVAEETARVVRKKGYELVGEAATGTEAVAMAAELAPDVILMDIKMPELDGIEASRRIRAIRPTPIVLLTAYETQELLHEASAAGVGAYLVKPPSAGAIERAVAIAMARHHDLLELQRLNDQLAARTRELEEALAEIDTLRDIIPICAKCKKVRDGEGYWQQVELYIEQHSGAKFSHGLCPACFNATLKSAQLWQDKNKT